MAQTRDPMAHKLNDTDTEIMAELVDGRNDDRPWGRATPSWLESRIGRSRQYIGNRLQMLSAADYVTRQGGGFYEITADGIEITETERVETND